MKCLHEKIEFQVITIENIDNMAIYLKRIGRWEMIGHAKTYSGVAEEIAEHIRANHTEIYCQDQIYYHGVQPIEIGKEFSP